MATNKNGLIVQKKMSDLHRSSKNALYIIFSFRVEVRVESLKSLSNEKLVFQNRLH